MSKTPKRPIDLQEYVSINGLNQFLYHRGTSDENPVLLYLHGGPGSVESLFAHTFQNNWEKIFTVVHWDQCVLGSVFIQKHPEDIAYYIGTGQVINMTENEKVGYDRVRELMIQAGNKKSLQKLEGRQDLVSSFLF
mgnify:FL=1